MIENVGYYTSLPEVQQILDLLCEKVPEAFPKVTDLFLSKTYLMDEGASSKEVNLVFFLNDLDEQISLFNKQEELASFIKELLDPLDLPFAYLSPVCIMGKAPAGHADWVKIF